MLIYIGKGNFLLQVPARDLTEEEIKGLEAKHGWKDLKKFLLDSGLYEVEKPKPKPEPKTKKEDE